MEEEQDWRIRQISEDEVRRFLVAKGTTDKCFSCGSDVWSMDGGSQDMFRSYPWGRPIKPDSVAVQLDPTAWGIPFVSMTCMTCGFIRAHSVHFIVSWLNTHPEADAEDA